MLTQYNNIMRFAKALIIFNSFNDLRQVSGNIKQTATMLLTILRTLFDYVSIVVEQLYITYNIELDAIIT